MSRNLPVTEYVRKLIREWRSSGRELKDLARAGGISDSHPSQVASGKFGVGGTTIAGYAKAFGTDEPELVKRAYEWWQTEGSATAQAADAARGTALSEAIATLLRMGQAEESELRAIAYAFRHERFTDRDVGWWMTVLLKELEHDRDREMLARAAKKEARNAAARTERLIEDKHAHMQRQRAELEKAQAKTDEPPASTRTASHAKPKKRAG